MPATNDTPLLSWRQVIQTAGQVLITALTTFAALPADQPLTSRLLTSLVSGLAAAGLILGYSKVPAPGPK